MDQQDQVPDEPANREPPAAREEPATGAAHADDSANDSTWGLGAASAMDPLRRHNFRSRRSKPAEGDERPMSE